MDKTTRVIRILSAALTYLTAAVFVQAYGLLKANWLHYGAKLDLKVLPLPTAFYHDYSWMGYVLPVAVALLLLKKDGGGASRVLTVEVLPRVVGWLALVWTLGAILAWQLPLYYPVARID
jgi:hypothetical protein